MFQFYMVVNNSIDFSAGSGLITLTKLNVNIQMKAARAFLEFTAQQNRGFFAHIDWLSLLLFSF